MSCTVCSRQCELPALTPCGPLVKPPGASGHKSWNTWNMQLQHRPADCLVVVTCYSVSCLPVLQYVRCPISTLCCGQAASMASLLLAAGEPGERRCLPNARIMVHQPIGGAQASAGPLPRSWPKHQSPASTCSCGSARHAHVFVVTPHKSSSSWHHRTCV